MRRLDTSRVTRGVPLAIARQRLAEIARIARESQNADSLCRHWPVERFEIIERMALDILESPPANLSAVAMDELQALRLAFGDDMARFSEALEGVYTKPAWRIAYLSYFIPFGLALLDDLTRFAQSCQHS